MDHDLVFIRKTRGLPAVKSLPPGLCNYTSRVVNIDSQGRVFVCLCEAWAPWSIGHVMDFQTIEQIWQHPQTQQIAHSQDLGEYQYCDTVHCNVEHQRRRQTTIQVYIGLDDSCQLSCPSCRQQPIFEKDYDIKLPWVERIVQWLKHRTDTVDVLIGSHGDPFASSLYQKIITDLSGVPVRFQLKTNGLLLQRYLSEIDILDQLTQLEISIDAATESTYEQVRRPGRWATLIDNLDYCLNIRKTKQPFQVRANFVVQKANYTEMLAFVELCRKYTMLPNFTVLQDWNTFDYRNNAVHLPGSADYDNFIKIITDPLVSAYLGRNFDNWTKS